MRTKIWHVHSETIHNKPKGLFTRTVSVSVKVSHCANENGPFDRQNGYRTHSARQTVRLY